MKVSLTEKMTLSALKEAIINSLFKKLLLDPIELRTIFVQFSLLSEGCCEGHLAAALKDSGGNRLFGSLSVRFQVEIY